MDLYTYFSKYSSKMNYLEKAFIQDVFYPDYGDKGLDLIIPQHKIYNESTGENYSYDFLLTTKKAKYLIETDGLYSHIQGKVSKEYFNKLQRKSNEMNLYGIPIRLVSESILKSPKEGRYDLRRQLIADDEMVKLRRGQSENIQPHEIQQEALDALNESRIRGNKRGLVSIATGVGKTYLSAFDVKQMKSESILFVVHITEVIRQSRISFEDVLYDRIDEMGSYFGGKKEISKNIIFASIQSLNKKSNLINFQRDQFDYVIIDETHHVAAPSYSKIFDYFTPKFFLGLTATPDRMDKKDILPYFNNNLVYEIDQKTAIEKGELVPYKYIGFKDDIDYSDIQWNGYKYNVEDLNKALLIDKRDKQILEKYNEYCNGKKTIGFCVSIEHAEWMANTFNKNGIKSVAIHSAVKDEDGSSELKGSEKSIKDFREGRYQVAFVVNMFNEGIDIIDTECLLFLRPTESRSIFTQQMGRGLRISPNKENVIILDFIGNYETATFITGGLGLSSFGKLEQCEGANGEKLLYHFDNNGSEVFFEEEVVQLLKELKSKESKEVDNDLIDEEWLDYSKFVKQSSVDNLYFKSGNQNKNIPIQLEALKIINDNSNITESEFKEKIDFIIEKKYINTSMKAGFRGLMISKILGLLSQTKPLKVKEPFELITQTIVDGEFEDYDKYSHIITMQLEKLYYWNSIFGSFNKYRESDRRVNFTEFNNYPILLINMVIIELMDRYGYEDRKITKEEFDYFIIFAKSLNEYKDIAELISRYREYKDKPELNKLLKQSTEKADSRLYNLLQYVEYYEFSPNGIKVKANSISNISKQVSYLINLLRDSTLITFKNNEVAYFKMLYSPISLVAYHKNYLA